MIRQNPERAGVRAAPDARAEAGPRPGPRAVPALLVVLVALAASARAETLGPVTRSVATEAAAVRLLSDALVRAVRNLGEQDEDRDEPVAAPVPAADFATAAIAPPAPEPGDEPGVGHAPVLGWHLLDMPPPTV
ncbi:MAG: hypothetical protein KDA05_09220 [Phycisphaerales bacterium]|nr:hypothetical protein [Phycisphaerales bacterium]